MRRRPFPGSVAAKQARASGRGARCKCSVSTALTALVAVIVYALVVDRITPAFDAIHDADRATSSGRELRDATRDEAYVTRRVAEELAALDEAAGDERGRERGGASADDERRDAKTSETSDERRDGDGVEPATVDAVKKANARGGDPVSSSERSETPVAVKIGDAASRAGYDAREWRRIRDSEPADDECHELPLSDYWGPRKIEHSVGVVKIESPRDCCELCKETSGCQFWRHDPQAPGECFTGKLMNDYLPPMYGEEHNKNTTSGVLYPKVPKYDAESTELKTCLHTMITSNGAPYMNWQTMVFYQTWKTAASEKDSILKHVTRILHRSKDDELMDLIPTWRVDPTHVECDNSCDYAVKDRARAIAQWMKTDDSKQCSHILMAETDYLFIRSPPPSVLLAKGHSYGFLFGYIVPSYPDAKEASVLLHDESKDGPLKDVYQTGNAPQSIHRDDLERVSEVWAEKVEFGETSEVIKRVFGWVRDMYAWSFASAAVRPKLKFELPPVPFQKLMIQPPADITIGQASVMHYTWGAIISDKTGAEVWKFDKREYVGTWNSLVRIPPLPPWDVDKEFQLQDKKRIQKSQYEVLEKMVDIFNRAVDDVNSELS